MKPRKKKTEEQKDSKAMQVELEELRETVEDLQKEKDELLDKLQRVSADYANFQKRVPKQIADSVGYQKERVIRSLLPTLDNFEHTVASVHSAEDVNVLVEGIRIIYDQMLDILKSHEVEQINAVGESFDPALHEAMMQKSVPGQEENIVLEEFQKGYKLNGRVIRPSKVIVNKITSEQPQQQEQTTDECEAVDEDERTGME